MPIESIQKLPSKAKSLFERTMETLKGKGYSDAKRAKIAWANVKRHYEKKEGKWVAKESMKEKSFVVNNVIIEKSINGNKFLEGYILTFDPDLDNDYITPQFAHKIQKDLTYGTFFHDLESKGVLEIVDSRVDSTGLWTKVKINNDHPYTAKVLSLVNDNKDNLAFSVRVSVPTMAQELIKVGDKYVNSLTDGTGLDFGITNIPINPMAKAKPL